MSTYVLNLRISVHNLSTSLHKHNGTSKLVKGTTSPFVVQASNFSIMHSPTPFLITFLSLLLTLSLAACMYLYTPPPSLFSTTFSSYNPLIPSRSRIPSYMYISLIMFTIPSAYFILQMHMFLQQYHHPTERASTSVVSSAAAVCVSTSFACP